MLKGNLVPRFSLLPVGRSWFGLVTCLPESNLSSVLLSSSLCLTYDHSFFSFPGRGELLARNSVKGSGKGDGKVFLLKITPQSDKCLTLMLQQQ